MSILNKLNINLNFMNSKNKRILSFTVPMIRDLEKEPEGVPIFIE